MTTSPDGGGAIGSRRANVKICVLGESTQEKLELIERFVLRRFDDTYIASLFSGGPARRTLKLGSKNGELVSVEMTLWNVQSPASVQGLDEPFDFSGVDGILGVCDATRIDSLQGLAESVRATLARTGAKPLVLVANKRWPEQQAKVREKDLAKVAAAYRCPYFFTTLTGGENVEPAFRKLAELVVRDLPVRGASSGE